MRQPRNKWKKPGHKVEFTVGARGGGPLAFQWQFNGAPLLNATQAVFVIESIRRDQAGDYSVVVSNPFGAVTSRPATLRIRPDLRKFRQLMVQVSRFRTLLPARREVVPPLHLAQAALSVGKIERGISELHRFQSSLASATRSATPPTEAASPALALSVNRSRALADRLIAQAQEVIDELAE